MKAAMRRIARLEKKEREFRRCEFWVLYEDGRVRQFGSVEIRWWKELPEPEPGVTRLFLSEADERL